MPAMTNLIVKDDASTPKAWTFIPITDTPDPFWRTNDLTLALEAQPRYTASSRKMKNGDYKISAKLELPVMETIGTAGASTGYLAPAKVAHTLTFIGTMFSSKRATAQDKANCLRMATAMMQGATSVVDTGTLANNALGNIWSASAAPITQLYVSLITPN